MDSDAGAGALGLDFGTTNTVVALSDGAEAGGGGSHLIEMTGDAATGTVFRSALCFWEEERGWNGIAHEAGPWASAEYLASPLDSRFVQSFKSVAANPGFDRALIFDRPFRFEELGQRFLQKLIAHAGGALDRRPARVVVGRPVEYAGARPDAALARQRYDRMLEGFGIELHYVYEPLGAAHSYAARLTEPATILVADFGGGTTDFSVVRVGPPGAARRCEPSPMPASASPAIGSTGASSIGWCCRCSAKRAIPVVRQAARYSRRLFHRLRRLVPPRADAQPANARRAAAPAGGGPRPRADRPDDRADRA